ncbi:MAG: hypothetical protein ABFQ53_01970 [Patescibacteria group bacterium]
MDDINKKITVITKDLDLGNINESKKQHLLDKIGENLTQRIILRMLEEVEEDKKEIFIEKINENKENPDKLLLFIDHFIENADVIVDEEIEKYKKDIENIL